MPWKVRQGGGCPPSKPWAVVLQADGSTVACHPTKGHAEAHMRALYANEPKMAVHGWMVEPEGLTASAWKPAGVLDDFDARYLGKMTAALDDSYKRMRALAVSRLRASALVASPFTLDDPNVFTAQDWADMFSVDAVDIIGDVVVDAATGSPLKIGLNLSDDDLVKLVDAHVQHLLGVGSDVAQSVSDTMQMAVRDGWSVDQTARELAATGPFSPDGARSFARTEISSAANAGMVAGWQADGTVGKIWLAVHDARTRAEHVFADGATVPIGQDFDIGGWPASAPGDLRLPPALRIACRCTVEAVNGGGSVQAGSIDTAGKKDLYRLAAQLKVRGRSTMSKSQLFDSIDAYRRGEGVQRIDRQTRAQLLTRAKDAGIKGRHGMDTATLRAELFARAPGARRALDAGYVVEGELSAIRQQVASVLKRTAIVAGACWIEEMEAVGQFGDPWHDDNGRFAPKGTGSTGGEAVKVPTAASVVEQINAEHPDVHLEISDKVHGEHHWELDRIIVPADQRGKGVGGTVMGKITSAADAAMVPVTLTPEPIGSGSKAALVRFYKSHGFVPNTGRNKLESSREAMVRYPAGYDPRNVH